MTISLEEAILAIESEGFKRTHKTEKVSEYESDHSGRVLYLRLDQGFPRHADVVIDPIVPLSSLIAVPEVELSRRGELRFGSNMTRFPKATNEGTEPEHYGRILNAFTADALKNLCHVYSQLP